MICSFRSILYRSLVSSLAISGEKKSWPFSPWFTSMIIWIGWSSFVSTFTSVCAVASISLVFVVSVSIEVEGLLGVLYVVQISQLLFYVLEDLIIFFIGIYHRHYVVLLHFWSFNFLQKICCKPHLWKSRSYILHFCFHWREFCDKSVTVFPIFACKLIKFLDYGESFVNEWIPWFCS